MRSIAQFLFYVLFIFQLPILSFGQVIKQKVQSWNTKQPSRFTENKGQVADQDGKPRNDVKYIYSAPGFKAIFKENSFSYEVFTVENHPKAQQISEATGKLITDNHLPDKFNEPEDATVKTNRIDIILQGANNHPQIIAEGKSSDYNNYYLAHMPEKGIQKVFNYTKITYKDVWPKIDLVFYARKEAELKYDIVLHPDAKLENVKFLYSGVEDLKLEASILKMETLTGILQEAIPYSYILNNKQKVNVTYTKQDNIVGFKGNYEDNKTLVIDPVIGWGTYFGDEVSDYADGISIDASGNVYLSGYTNSDKNIATTGAYQTTYGYNIDAFVAKFNSTGARLWATYFGGSNKDFANGISIDAFDNLYITGRTESTSKISTLGAYQTTYSGLGDAFVAKFNSSGVRQWATYFGGSGNEYANAISIDKADNIYIVGTSTSTSNIATTGAYQTANKGYEDIFLTKFDSSGNRKWATYFGGNSNDYASAISFDKSGNVFITGYGSSRSDIATTGTQQTIYGGGNADAYLVKFDSTGSRKWATYYGRSYGEYPNGICCDLSGKIYIAGYTDTKSDIATTNAHQTIYGGGGSDAFIIKFDTSGVSEWATYFGGSSEDVINDIVCDKKSNIYITGFTGSLNAIATAGAPQTTLGGAGDVMNAKFDSTGTLKLATYFGGKQSEYGLAVALDTFDNLHIAGYTMSTNNIATSGAYQTILGGLEDAFVLKYYNENPDAGIFFIDSISSTSCVDKDTLFVRVKNFSLYSKLDSINIDLSLNGIKKASVKYNGIIKAGDTSAEISLGKVSFRKGINIIKVWTNQPNGHIDAKSSNDTLTKSVTIYPKPKASFASKNSCLHAASVLTNTSTIDSGNVLNYFWDLGDGNTSTLKDPLHTYDSIGQYKVVLKVTSSYGCTDTFSQTIAVFPKPKAYFTTTNICLSETAYFTDSSNMAADYFWSFGDSSISHLQNPMHKYFSAGTYMVKLVVKNALGCSDTFTKSIVVSDMPKAIFSVHDICYTENLELADSSKGATERVWKFGDDSNTDEQNPTHYYGSAGTYNIWLIVSNKAGCKDSVMHTITVDSTCVWPGDANADKIVDNKDILAIGVAYSDTGGTRIDTSTIWKANLVKNWSNNFSSGANYKHADSDGDGIVSNTDTMAVTRNYSKTHLKNSTSNRGKNTDPLLKIDIQNDSLKAGDTLVAYILLGENALPAKDVYGLAFSLNYNHDLFSLPTVDFTGNWLGNSTIGYSNFTNGLDLAITKTDYINKTGYGKMATVKMIMRKDADIDLKQIKLEISDNVLISFDETKIPVNIADDSVQIFKQPNSIQGKDYVYQPEVKIFPNPFSSQTTIAYNLIQPGDVRISLYDINGRMINIMHQTRQITGEHHFVLDANTYKIHSGVYLIKVEIDNVPVYKRIVKVE